MNAVARMDLVFAADLGGTHLRVGAAGFHVLPRASTWRERNVVTVPVYWARRDSH